MNSLSLTFSLSLSSFLVSKHYDKMLKTRRLRPDEEDHNTYHLAVRIREQQQYYNYFYPTALSQINQSIILLLECSRTYSTLNFLFISTQHSLLPPLSGKSIARLLLLYHPLSFALSLTSFLCCTEFSLCTAPPPSLSLLYDVFLLFYSCSLPFLSSPLSSASSVILSSFLILMKKLFIYHTTIAQL